MRRRINLVLGLVFALELSAGEPCLQSYQSAEAGYQKFLKDRSQIKYHHNWEKIAQRFEQIAKSYPDCEKADDAWFKLGKIWLDCYKFSQNSADLKRALSAFSELVKRYPKSPLADDALLLRGEIYLNQGEKERAREEFEKLLAKYPSQDSSAQAKKYLRNLGTSSSSKSKAGSEDSEKIFSSELESSAQKAPVRKNDAIALLIQKSETVSQAPESGAIFAELVGIRYWSAPSYTRVVMDLSKKIEFSPARLLQPDPSLGTPPRLYIDLFQTRLSPEFRTRFEYKEHCYELPIGDGLLRRARASQYQPEVVRVVLDLESISEFQTLSFPGENGSWRIVIDTFGETPAHPSSEPLLTTIPGTTVSPLPKPISEPKPQPKAGPREELKEKPPVIVIDAGHGGKDPGAIGKARNQEKTIALNIAKYLEQELKKSFPKAKIILTRRDDRFLSLEERTAKANALEAELTQDQAGVFISIHCNASPDRSAYGIETYYLDNTTDRAVLRLAARENFVSEEVMEKYYSDVNLILADLTTQSKVSYSIPLAHRIQENLVKELSKNYSGIKNLGVKKAPFWVLTGARMPCVLIETGFISNPTEEKRLVSPSYQKAIAKGIAQGIEDWLKNPKPLLIP